jgi:hypothetical protein
MIVGREIGLNEFPRAFRFFFILISLKYIDGIFLS